jgi:hypothetical protein
MGAGRPPHQGACGPVFLGTSFLLRIRTLAPFVIVFAPGRSGPARRRGVGGRNASIADAVICDSNGSLGVASGSSIPTYDIDDKAAVSGIAPEIDLISFDGEFIKTLSGINNQWVNDSFPIDISKVKFNQPNELRIDIDTGNAGSGEYWCMAVDWVAIELDAAAPFVLAHGISAQADTWDDADAGANCATMANGQPRQLTDGEIDPLADAAPFGTKGYTYDALRLAYQLIRRYTLAVNLGNTTTVAVPLLCGAPQNNTRVTPLGLTSATSASFAVMRSGTCRRPSSTAGVSKVRSLASVPAGRAS